MRSDKAIVVFSAAILLAAFCASAQMHRGDQRGHCPMCGRQWNGANHYAPTIPDSLAAPSGREWRNRLSRVMGRERLSKAQYTRDRDHYKLRMPYHMVIPQEDDHIAWIEAMYRAFGLTPPDSTPPIIETQSARDALQTALQLEEELIPDYEWLIAQTANDTIMQLLGDILYQTRMHRSMFQHALSMGGMHRYSGAASGNRTLFGMRNGHMQDGWGGGATMVLWILIIALATFAIFRWLPRRESSPPRGDSALDILKRRYAHGELSREEFAEKKKDLQ
jgi:uncharacterized membrane protein